MSPSDGAVVADEGGCGSAATAEAQWRRATARALRIGLWVWPSFFLLDVYMAKVVFPGAPLGSFAAYRVVEEALLLLVYLVAERPSVPAGVVRVLNSLAYVLAATLIAVMAIALGGLTSDYMHGLSIVILVDATTRPGPWRQSLRSLVPTAISFPVVMAVAVLHDPTLAQQWLAAASIKVFVAKYVFVVAAVAVGAVAAQTVWAAQQQVYAARRLGRYRLQAPIGRGGMNEVWLAWDATLRRNVALKILRLADGSDPHELARFEREARAASTLSSPHTIRSFDFGASDDGVHFIAMEYLAGADLAAVVKARGPMPPGRVAHIALQARGRRQRPLLARRHALLPARREPSVRGGVGGEDDVRPHQRAPRAAVRAARRAASRGAGGDGDALPGETAAGPLRLGRRARCRARGRRRRVAVDRRPGARVLAGLTLGPGGRTPGGGRRGRSATGRAPQRRGNDRRVTAPLRAPPASAAVRPRSGRRGGRGSSR
jgi:hypothetical protein